VIDRSGLLVRARAVAQVVVDHLDGLTMSEEDVQHLARVLRLRPGEAVIACDGAGSWRSCAWASEGNLEPVGEVRSEARPTPLITVGFSLPKGDRPEWIVQKLTELGVDVIEPLVTDRTVVKWDERKAGRNVERLRRVAYEAAMQSRRLWLPRVADLAGLPRGAALAQPGGERASLQFPHVVVGPEGGWSQDELARSSSVIDLGSTVLRAETAAITVGAHLCALRADLTDYAASVKPDREADTVRASGELD
jgi:16S rRNA (uracil1498-N3)-methyltransferase